MRWYGHTLVTNRDCMGKKYARNGKSRAEEKRKTQESVPRRSARKFGSTRADYGGNRCGGLRAKERFDPLGRPVKE